METEQENGVADATQIKADLPEWLIMAEKEPVPYSTKEEIALFRAFGILEKKQLLKANTDNTTQNITGQPLRVMTSDNVVMIIAKSEAAKRILQRFTTTSINEQKMPRLEFVSDGTRIRSKYNAEYLKMLLPIVSCERQSITISMKSDYPIVMQNSHFAVILAPR